MENIEKVVCPVLNFQENPSSEIGKTEILVYFNPGTGAAPTPTHIMCPEYAKDGGRCELRKGTDNQCVYAEWKTFPRRDKEWNR